MHFREEDFIARCAKQNFNVLSEYNDNVTFRSRERLTRFLAEQFSNLNFKSKLTLQSSVMLSCSLGASKSGHIGFSGHIYRRIDLLSINTFSGKLSLLPGFF